MLPTASQIDLLTLAKQRKLSAKYGFKVVSGFGDRVIFKELFLDGLTLSDAGLSPKVRMNLSLIAARQELREIMKQININ